MRKRGVFRQLLAACCTLAVGGCHETPCPAPSADEAAGLEVLFDGCTVARGGCVAAAGDEVTVWLAAALDWRIDVRLPKGWEERSASAHAGGRRLVLVAGQRAPPGTLIVSATRDDRCARWSLDLVVEQADADAGAPVTADPADRLDRLARQLARQDESWQGVLLLAIAHHQRAGRVDRALRDWAFLHQQLVDDAAFDLARLVLDRMPRHQGLEGRSATARFLAAYQRALHAEYTADPGAAAGWSERALRVATRLDWPAFEAIALQLLARQRRQLGLHAQADDDFAFLASRADALPFNGMQRSRLLNNIGWDRLMSHDFGRPAEDPRPLLEHSLALLTDETTEERQERVGRHINLALAALQHDDPSGAAVHVRAAHDVEVAPWPRDVLWLRIIEARLALAENEPAAALDLVALDRVASEGAVRIELLTPDVRLAIATIEAQARLALGQRRRGLAILTEAQTLLDDVAAGLLPGSAAATTVAQDVPLTRLWLAQLLADDQTEAAFDAVRRAFARISGGYAGGVCLERLTTAERARWSDEAARLRGASDRLNESASRLDRLPRDARARARERLQSAADTLVRDIERWQQDLAGRCGRTLRDSIGKSHASDLVLAVYPMADAWLSFLAEDGRVDVARLPRASDETSKQIAQRVLDAHAGRLIDAGHAGGRTLRILAWGNLATEVDFHALPLAGEVLVAHVPVVYEIALPRQHADDSRRAGVVGDPLRDLPHAAREAAFVATTLRDRDLDVTTLFGERADGVATRALFERMDHLHFAGHGEVDAVRGETALVLAGRGRLTTGDLWLLESVPEVVVLLACNTFGVSDAHHGDLARTLVARGADLVVASIGDVDDRAAAEFSRRLYAAWRSGTAAAEAVRSAQLGLRASAPEGDWHRFRLFGRSGDL